MIWKKRMLLPVLLLAGLSLFAQKRTRVREAGITIGVMKPGKHNAITDVEGVLVGHTTLLIADSIRTGVTAILPHNANLFQQKVPAAVFVGNGFGKLQVAHKCRNWETLKRPLYLPIPSVCRWPCRP